MAADWLYPLHPLISLIDYRSIKHSADSNYVSWVCDFFLIAMKKNIDVKLRYGQQDYDFDEGTMFFIAPGQVFRIEVNRDLPAAHTRKTDRKSKGKIIGH